MDLLNQSSSSDDMEEVVKKYAQQQIPAMMEEFWGFRPEDEDLNLTSRINFELEGLKQSVKFEQKLTVVNPILNPGNEVIKQEKIEQIKIKGDQELEPIENLIDTDVLDDKVSDIDVQEDHDKEFSDSEELKVQADMQDREKDMAKTVNIFAKMKRMEKWELIQGEVVEEQKNEI